MDKKRLLIFAHYYYPDVASTGQLLKDLAEGMQDEFDVTVICTVPSYDGVIADHYKTQKYYFETIHGVRVIRVRVRAFSKADKVSRVRNILSYFFGALGAARRAGAQDYILTISQPPILGGLLGVCGKRLKRAKMIYCIQDFNPEQVQAVSYSENRPLLAAMLWLDKLSCKESDLVITVGRDLVDTLKGRFQGQNVPKHVMINNWINEQEIYPLPAEEEGVCRFKAQYGLEHKFVIMYSGNLGLYYDLLNLMKVIETFKPGTKTADGREVVFAFVGDGSVRNAMAAYKEEHQMDNVIFIPYQDKNELIYSLNAGDVHWCVNSKGIKGVSCPSKFYGIAAVGKPVLGVLEGGSEIEILIRETGCGLVCAPGDYGQIQKNIRWFIENAADDYVARMGDAGCRYLRKELPKAASIEKYKKAIREC